MSTVAVETYMPDHVHVGDGLYRCTDCGGYVWEDRHLHERRVDKCQCGAQDVMHDNCPLD